MPATLIALAVVATFFPVVAHPFLHWDDAMNLSENPDFNPVSWLGVARYWREPCADLYIPVTYTTWGAIAELTSTDSAGLNAAAFHAANLVVHVSAALAVFFILRALRAAQWPAVAGALLYSLHPLAVESVAWAAGFKDVLSGALCLWALFAYFRSVNGAETAAGFSPVAYATATALFGLAMLAKPQAVCLPLIAVAIDALLLRRPWRRVAAWTLPWFALTVPIIVIARHVQPASENVAPAPVLVRLLTAADDLGFYLIKLVLPIHHTIDYGRTTSFLLASPQRFFTWIIPAAVVAMAIALRRRAPWAAAATAIFVAALLPILGLVPFDFQTYSNVADHYTYVALFGPALFACFLLTQLENTRFAHMIRIATTLLLVMLAGDSFVQTRHWGDDHSLFAHALDVNPLGLTGNVNIGIERLQDGDLANAERLLQAALRAEPDDVKARINLASLRAAQGRVDEAIGAYEGILVKHPGSADAHYNLANVLRQLPDRLPGAIDHYRAAVRLNPGSAVFHANLGLTLLQTGLTDKAFAEIRTSLALDPGNAKLWTALANAQAERGDVAGALESFKSALRADPGFPPALQGAAQARRFLGKSR